MIKRVLVNTIILLTIMVSSNNVVADTLKAKFDIKHGNYSEALKFLNTDNSSESMYLKGHLYEYGLGVKRDLSEAFKYFLAASKLGHVKAQYRLCDLYEVFMADNLAFPISMIELYKWEKIALLNYNKISNKSPEDMYRLGVLYNPGIGLNENQVNGKYGISGKSKSLSNKWLMEAAKLGHKEGQYMVGVLYEIGDGVKLDKKLAMYWYKKAAEQGHELALKAYNKLNK